MSTRPTLIIGNKNYSSWSLRGWLLLKHLGCDFEEVRISLNTDGYKEQLLRYSDSGKVPVLIDGGITIWDSLAICEYQAERHPGLWPADPKARAIARCVSAEMHSGFTDLRNEMPMNCRARGRSVDLSDRARADVARIEQIWTSCIDEYGGQGPWLFGAFSTADVMYAPVASRLRTYGIAIARTATLYIETMLSQPLMRDWYHDAELEAEVIEQEEVGR